jgi:hypothetical protein
MSSKPQALVRKRKAPLRLPQFYGYPAHEFISLLPSRAVPTQQR